MSALVIIVGALIASIYIWGVVRTAIWLVPTLFISHGNVFASIGILSFLTSASLLIPHDQGSFDARDLSKERKVLILFLSGILGGTFIYHAIASPMVFIFSAAAPFILLQLYTLLRQPVPLVYFRTKKLKFILPLLWIICFGVLQVELMMMAEGKLVP